MNLHETIYQEIKPQVDERDRITSTPIDGEKIAVLFALQRLELFTLWCSYAGYMPVLNSEIKDENARLACSEFNFNDLWIDYIHSGEEATGETYSTEELYEKFKQENQ